MNFVEHNLKISPIKTGYSSIYRLDQMSGSEEHPLIDTLFITDDNIKELVELWLMNSGYERQRDWLLDRLKDLDAAVEQQQQ